ncbi:MAG: ATP-dependent DNA helicase RecQ [Candidatus Lustribacter sp.]|jgi:ATP-dependent DNA helicase RecQ
MIIVWESPVDLYAALRERFGYDTFNPGQEEVITRVLAGEDTLAILATGAGKSLCYQLPALMLPGTTVVVSPLIALMKDQLDMLESHGVRETVALNSTLSEDQEAAALARIASGAMKIVFVTPEKLEDDAFVAILQSLTVPLFVIDEAHCISQWGHDFRPAYLNLGRVIKALGGPTVLALTATATPAVREDILAQLGVPDVKPIVRGFDRPNLIYSVRRAENEAGKLRALKALFENNALEGTGIIYTATIKNALEVQKYLQDQLEIPAAVYHSKLQKHDRVAVHELFMQEAIRAVVATNAFGLGIDKPNIRFVVHYDLPGSIEAYTQEAGRAGRDGEPSKCILVYRMSDTRVQNYFLTGKYPDIEEVQRVFGTLEIFGMQEGGVSLTDLRKITQLPLTKLKVVLALLKKAGFIEASARAKYVLARHASREAVLDLANYETKKRYDQSKLAMMLQYAETTGCRRRFILNYFGENFTADSCGACENCLQGRRDQSISGYGIADVVYHSKFGQGTVERAEKDLVTVLFPAVGYKTLLASAVSREMKIA